MPERIINIVGPGFKTLPDKGEIWAINFSFLPIIQRLSEIWSAFDFPQQKARVTKVFMMDGINGLSSTRQSLSRSEERQRVVNMFNDLDLELVTPTIEKGVNKSTAYPLNQVKKTFEIMYFKSTIAYALAAAALLKPKEVHLYGIYQSSYLEYLFERPAVEYWIGVLIGQGAKVESHDRDTRLFGGRPVFGGRTLYGYESSEWWALRKAKKHEKDFISSNQ